MVGSIYSIRFPLVNAILFILVALVYSSAFVTVTILTYISLYVKTSMLSHISAVALRMHRVAYVSIMIQVGLTKYNLTKRCTTATKGVNRRRK